LFYNASNIQSFKKSKEYEKKTHREIQLQVENSYQKKKKKEYPLPENSKSNVPKSKTFE
jgi:hypothetical protein